MLACCCCCGERLTGLLVEVSRDLGLHHRLFSEIENGLVSSSDLLEDTSSSFSTVKLSTLR
jgi:hypothetical protein